MLCVGNKQPPHLSGFRLHVQCGLAGVSVLHGHLGTQAAETAVL